MSSSWADQRGGIVHRFLASYYLRISLILYHLGNLQYAGSHFLPGETLLDFESDCCGARLGRKLDSISAWKDLQAD